MGDFIIFLSYTAIPAGLAVTLIRRRDLPFPKLVALFVAFIMACGLTHLLDAVMFYEPMYRLLRLFKVLTAIVSFTTAVVLVSSLPHLLAIPSVRATNEQLREALERESALRAELESARNALETRTGLLTSRSRRMALGLAGARAAACRWVAGARDLDWIIGYSELATELGLPHGEVDRWDELLSDMDADLLAASERAAESTGVLVFRAYLRDAASIAVRIEAAFEPAVRDAPRTLVGLIRLEAASGAAG